MEGFIINHATCSECGICMKVCPSLCFALNEDKKVMFREEMLHLCLGCGQCMAVCKTASVTARGLDYEQDFFELSANEDFFSLAGRRRSVRRFKPRPVGRDKIEKILAAIALAPHGDSKHHVEVTVVNSREKIMDALPLISRFYDDLKNWLHNPVISRMIQFRQGKDGMNKLRNHLLPRISGGLYKEITAEYDGITRGAHTLLIFHAQKDAEEHKEDSYILVTYAMLAAEALGLGTTIIGLIPPAINKVDEVRDIFRIPRDHEAVISLIIGYPKYHYYRGIKRKLKEIHWLN